MRLLACMNGRVLNFSAAQITVHRHRSSFIRDSSGQLMVGPVTKSPVAIGYHTTVLIERPLDSNQYRGIAERLPGLGGGNLRSR